MEKETLKTSKAVTLFEKCGNCGQEIPKFADFKVYGQHYNAECVN